MGKTHFLLLILQAAASGKGNLQLSLLQGARQNSFSVAVANFGWDLEVFWVADGVKVFLLCVVGVLLL